MFVSPAFAVGKPPAPVSKAFCLLDAPRARLRSYPDGVRRLGQDVSDIISDRPHHRLDVAHFQPRMGTTAKLFPVAFVKRKLSGSRAGWRCAAIVEKGAR
jgi:hypothetical protein